MSPTVQQVKGPTRWILYARISLDANGDEVSTDEQMFEMDERFEGDEGAVVAARFRDKHRSASRYAKRSRELYQEAFRLLAEGEADAILFWDMDRLLRQPRELEDLIDLCDPRMGGRNIIVQQHTSAVPFDLLSADGRAHARGVVTAAARESDKISERVKRSRRRRRREGLPAPTAAYGWDSTTQINAAEAVEVRAMVGRVLGGEALNTIARSLNERSVPCKSATQRRQAHLAPAKWAASNVKAVLTTPRNYGLLRHPDGTIEPGSFHGICAASEFHAVERALADRSRRQRPRRLTLLTRLVHCATCGTPMLRNTSVSYSGEARTVLACKGVEGRRSACGGHTSIDSDAVDSLITEAVVGWVDEMDLAAHLGPTANLDVATLQGALLALEAKLQEATAKWLLPDEDPGHWDYDRYDAVALMVKDQKEDLLARLATATARSVLGPFAGQPGALRDAWGPMSVEVRREVIMEALDLRHVRIEVEPRATRLTRKWDPANGDMVAAEQARVHLRRGSRP